ncbi:NAD(P)H-dependent oxidoreductase [Candidatus Roizmanbacteria bacterium]|nr:NAD(P)H-dependent oxidoreductase [Candidatus Roizmanbacteria bacterium]
MKISIINGTNRIGNKTIQISLVAQQLVEKSGYESVLITLDNFNQLFRGEYITLKKANRLQKKDIAHMIEADILIFVVPTYHGGIPSPLKNFLDILKSKEAFDNKVIGIIGSSDDNRDLGARQTAQIINAILSYYKLKSFVIPRINITNFDDIDRDRLVNYIQYCISFLRIYDRSEQSYLGDARGHGFLRLSRLDG